MSYGEGGAKKKKKIVEVRRLSDDCCSFLRGSAEVGLWICSAKWMKF